MTENSVPISITIKVSEREIHYEKEIEITEMEEGVGRLVTELGQEVIRAGIQEMDDRIAKNVPGEWRNVGTEERWVVSGIGAFGYRRRIYLDENKRRRKPVDELLGIAHYGRTSGRVEEMGSSLASEGTYRLAAKQLSWMLKTSVSHGVIQRMVWKIGNRIADGEEAERKRIFEAGGEVEAGKVKAEVLYGESDGVWIHLQHEKRKSAEVRVAILSTGRKPVGKERYRLENKRCITSIGLNSQEWQEQILRETHVYYDLEKTNMLITGGDGNQWVRHSFERIGLPQEFVLDRFHLSRAARRAFRDRAEAKRIVTKLRQEGFMAVNAELRVQIQQAVGKKKERLVEFYQYVHHNQDGLLDLIYRGHNLKVSLGAIEGNVDKLVVHRMKGRGCSWRLRGVRAMLALCRNCNQLKSHAYRYLPMHDFKKIVHPSPNLEVEYSEAIDKPMPIFQGPDQDKPWVRTFFRFIHAR
jgi:hypothetical protein